MMIQLLFNQPLYHIVYWLTCFISLIEEQHASYVQLFPHAEVMYIEWTYTLAHTY